MLKIKTYTQTIQAFQFFKKDFPDGEGLPEGLTHDGEYRLWDGPDSTSLEDGDYLRVFACSHPEEDWYSYDVVFYGRKDEFEEDFKEVFNDPK